MTSQPPDDAAVRELERDIATRLAGVCGHLSDVEFRDLVHEIAVTKRRAVLREMNETERIGAAAARSAQGLAQRMGSIPHAPRHSGVPQKRRE